MSSKITFSYNLNSAYCSDLQLVPKNEFGYEPDSMIDIYNVHFIGETDENGEDYIRVRTRYFWSSPENPDVFLHCFSDSHLYIQPNPSIIASDLNFAKLVLEAHDKFAFDCLSTKSIQRGEFLGFEGLIDVKKIDYEKHGKVMQQWMIEGNK